MVKCFLCIIFLISFSRVLHAEEIKLKTIEGEIHGNLYDSLLENLGTDPKALEISEHIALAFKDEFDTTKGLRARASFSFDIIAYYDQENFLRFGEVMKASLIIGKAISRKVIQEDLEEGTWSLLPIALEEVEKPFYLPVKSSRVSSFFQLNRRHPVTKRIQPHNGIDFVSPSGSPVYPALDGIISAMGRTRSKGKFVLIQHDNGYVTTYDHLKKFQKGLRVGKKVEIVDQIGEVGRTGFATGAHLHFGILQDGYYVNPLELLKEVNDNLDLDSDEEETID